MNKGRNVVVHTAKRGKQVLQEGRRSTSKHAIKKAENNSDNNLNLTKQGAGYAWEPDTKMEIWEPIYGNPLADSVDLAWENPKALIEHASYLGNYHVLISTWGSKDGNKLFPGQNYEFITYNLKIDPWRAMPALIEVKETDKINWHFYVRQKVNQNWGNFMEYAYCV